MLSCLKAENLKYRRTFIRRFALLAPAVILLLTSLSPDWRQVSGLNWWYGTMLPGCLTVMAVLTDQKDGKKLGYRAVHALPVSLIKVWIAKVLVTAEYTALATGILTVVILGYGPLVPHPIAAWRILTAAVLMVLTVLWQIPLCLFLSCELGMAGAVLVNVGGGMLLGFFLVGRPFWWACPYCWTLRLMSPVLGILPNGLVGQPGDPMLSPGVLPVGAALSAALFVLLLLVTARWFAGQEVR